MVVVCNLNIVWLIDVGVYLLCVYVCLNCFEFVLVAVVWLDF